MPCLSTARITVLAVVGSLSLSAAATAQGPAAVPAANTITVFGSAQVRPMPANAQSNASIAEAVRGAEAAATPLALADGRARAERLAQLAGLRLGALLAIAEGTASPFGAYGPFGQQGTFGPGVFCGTIRSSRVVKGKDGKQRRVVRSRRGCRVPRYIAASLTMTFASSPA